MDEDLNPLDIEAAQAALRSEEEREKLARAQYLEDLRFVMGDRRGRNVLRELLGRCGVMRGGFIADPCEASFKAGERNIGLRTVNDMMEVDALAYVKMITEEQR